MTGIIPLLLLVGTWIYLSKQGSTMRTLWLALSILDTLRATRTVRQNGRRIGVNTRRKALREALVCWVVFVALQSSAPTIDFVLGWIPFYTQVKMLVSIFFLFSRLAMSHSIYETFISPLLRRYETPIDLTLLLFHSLAVLVYHYLLRVPVLAILESLYGLYGLMWTSGVHFWQGVNGTMNQVIAMDTGGEGGVDQEAMEELERSLSEDKLNTNLERMSPGKPTRPRTFKRSNTGSENINDTAESTRPTSPTSSLGDDVIIVNMDVEPSSPKRASTSDFKSKKDLQLPPTSTPRRPSRRKNISANSSNAENDHEDTESKPDQLSIFEVEKVVEKKPSVMVMRHPNQTAEASQQRQVTEGSRKPQVKGPSVRSVNIPSKQQPSMSSSLKPSLSRMTTASSASVSEASAKSSTRTIKSAPARVRKQPSTSTLGGSIASHSNTAQILSLPRIGTGKTGNEAMKPLPGSQKPQVMAESASNISRRVDENGSIMMSNRIKVPISRNRLATTKKPLKADDLRPGGVVLDEGIRSAKGGALVKTVHLDSDDRSVSVGAEGIVKVGTKRSATGAGGQGAKRVKLRVLSDLDGTI